MSEPARELAATERAFAAACADSGLHHGFLAYLAADGFVFAPEPVNGKEHHRGKPEGRGLLQWAPGRVEVSRDGTLGYTAGPWRYRTGGPGGDVAAEGHYHSVWRRDADGRWRLVADIGTGGPSEPWPAEPATAGLVKRGGDASFDDLRALDAEASERAGTEGAGRALAARFAPDVLLSRDGAAPVEGAGPAGLALGDSLGAAVWTPGAGGVASSGDLGYTLGRVRYAARAEGSGGSYLRVWRRDPGRGWTIAMDVEIPAPAKD